MTLRGTAAWTAAGVGAASAAPVPGKVGAMAVARHEKASGIRSDGGTAARRVGWSAKAADMSVSRVARELAPGPRPALLCVKDSAKRQHGKIHPEWGLRPRLRVAD